MPKRSGPNGLARRASAANATNESGGEAETQAEWGAAWGRDAKFTERSRGGSQRSAAGPSNGKVRRRRGRQDSLWSETYTSNGRAVRRFLDARAERAAGRARDTVLLVKAIGIAFARRTWRGLLAQRTPPRRAARSGDTVWSIIRGLWGARGVSHSAAPRKGRLAVNLGSREAGSQRRRVAGFRKQRC